MHDYLISLIRTLVPVAVGAGITWLAQDWGLVLDQHTSALVAATAVAVTTAAYYAIVRGLEQRWPAFGRLLGRRAQPMYLRSDGQGGGRYRDERIRRS